jgi:hypothetical protein
MSEGSIPNPNENKEYNIKLALAFFFAVTIIFAGIFIFRRVEHWSYVDAFYFSVITLTTIGYGDVVPKTEIGKILAALFALIGVGIFLFCVSIIAENYFFKRMVKFDKSIDNKVTRKISESLKTMDRKIKFIEQMKNRKKNIEDKKKEKVDEKNEK